MIARGKFGPKVERILWLKWFELLDGSSEDDSVYELRQLRMRFERLGLGPANVSMSTIELCPLARLPSEARDPCEKSGLCKLVLALLRMNDCLFSCILRPSAMLSLLTTILILLRLPVSATDVFAMDRPVNVDLVGGRGKSDGLVDSTLVPLVLKDAQLLRSMVADSP